MLAILNASGNISTFVPASADAPAIPAAVLEQMSVCKDEAELVKVVTPILRDLFGLGAAEKEEENDPFSLVLLNSEKVRWLDDLVNSMHLSQRRKPDIYMTWAPFTKPLATCGASALADRALQLDGCVPAVFEGKEGTGAITEANFGQLVDYHTSLPGECRGMVFNARAVWLYASKSGSPLRLVKAEWGAPGSLELIRDFFMPAKALPEPPLLVLMRRLALSLDVVPCEAVTKGGSFLGAGGSGRVFAVRSLVDSTRRALKVCCSTPHAVLSVEFKLMTDALSRGAPVASVVPESLRQFHDVVTGSPAGGGYLMSEVLLPFDVTSKKRCVAAFSSLRKLHESGLVHGDARLPNLLRRVGSFAPVWIDMRVSFSVVDHALRADAKTLALSILSTAFLDETVETALASVPGDASAYTGLAAAVWLRLSPKV